MRGAGRRVKATATRAKNGLRNGKLMARGAGRMVRDKARGFGQRLKARGMNPPPTDDINPMAEG